MKLALAAATAGLALLTACRADPSHRQETLAAGGRTDRALAAESVTALLRAPTESTRIIYSRPTELARPDTGTAASPPSGAATPDSARSRGSTAPAAATPTPGAARPSRPDTSKPRPRTGG